MSPEQGDCRDGASLRPGRTGGKPRALVQDDAKLAHLHPAHTNSAVSHSKIVSTPYANTFLIDAAERMKTVTAPVSTLE
jgi:hypothetical protein